MSRKTRKLIWSAPLVVVLAVAGALAMFVAQGTGSVFADPLPGAPANLEVEAADGDAGRTTLVLNWDAAANASGYRIDKADNGAVWETLTMDTGNAATTYMDTTLTADDTRWYRVFAVNSHGIGPVSNAVSGDTDTKVSPGSVMNLRAAPNAKNPRRAIDLSWDPPADDGGEKIVGYEVQFHNGADWGSFTATFLAGQVSVTTKTTLTDETDLDPGDSRLYRVRAINGPDEVAAGDGNVATPTENTVSEDWARTTGTTAAATVPGPVTGLTAVNTGTGGDEINLYWYAPEDTGGWDISGYLIQARRAGKKFPAIPADDALTTEESTNITLGDATNNPDNMNRFIALPAAGVMQASFTGIVATLDTNADGNADARERWYFRVFALTTDDGPDNDLSTAADNVIRRSRDWSNTASSLPAVRAIDHDGDGGGTAAVDLLAPPVITPTGASNNSSEDAKKQRIDLGLALNPALVTNNQQSGVPAVIQNAYRIDYSENAGLTWKLLERDTRFTGFSETKPYTDDDGLAFDDVRSYRVFAIGRHPYTDVGLSSAISTGMTAASTIPGAPTGVMASSPSLSNIDASWTAPEDNGGQDIVKYYYQYIPDDLDGVAEATDFADATNRNPDVNADAIVNVHNSAMTMGMLDATLAGDTVYAFRVAAVNKAADGTTDRPADDASEIAWSEPVLFNTSEAAKPNKVEGLTSERATDASGDERGVNLLWNKPSDEIDIENYDVEVRNNDGNWVNPTNGEDLPPTKTAYTDSAEPEEGEERLYRVRATNDVGEGEWTMVYYPRDPATHEHNVAPMAVGSIDAQTVTAGQSVTVDVAANFSDANTGDTLTYAAVSSMTDFATVSVSGSMVTITGVAEGTATITVTATDDDGETATQTIMVTVTAAMLTAPTNVMAMLHDADGDGDPGEFDIRVTWTPGQGATQHAVILFDSDYNFDPGTGLATNQDSGDTTFRNVASGDYIVAVAAVDADFEIEIGFAMVTVP